MQIPTLDQEDADIDWFITDSNGHILHVASGGGILPESVAASQEVLLELHQYFLAWSETDSTLAQLEAESRKQVRLQANDAAPRLQPPHRSQPGHVK